MRVQQRMLSIGLAVALGCLHWPGSWALAGEGDGVQQAGAAASVPSRSVTSGPQDMRSPADTSKLGDDEPPRAPGVKLIDEGRLKERVQARWDAAINGEFTKAYAFETPEFRKANKPEDYAFRLGRASVRWHVASLKELRYDQADQADAVVTLEFSFAIPGGDALARTSGDFPERWVFLDGDWWREDIRGPVGGRPQPKPSLEQ